jgi:energy-coupling factor transporter transmembrane protein EcfT
MRFEYMVSPYMKLAYKFILVYIVSCFILGFIYYIYTNFLLLIILFILTGIIICLSCSYFMERLERQELSNFLDDYSRKVRLDSASPKKLKEMEFDDKEEFLDFIQKI